MGQPIVHFEVMGKDAHRARKFYAELFGWKIADPIADMGNYALVDGETSRVAGGLGEEPDGTTRVTIYVEVPDLQQTLDQAVAMGGKIVMPPMEIPGMVSLAQFADPDGNLIGLVKSQA